jgi:hypothetical protein
VSFEGNKYYVKDPRFHLQVVEIEVNPDNSITVRFGEEITEVQPIRMKGVTVVSHPKRPGSPAPYRG